MDTAEKQGREAEPLVHPISRGVEFEIRLSLQTPGVDEVELVNKTKGTVMAPPRLMLHGFPHTRFAMVGGLSLFNTSSASKK